MQKKLANRLLLEENEDASAEDVLQDVYFVEYFTEQGHRHYLNVIMKDVDIDSELNNYDSVYEYLTQNVPVAYDADKFKWGREIKLRLKNEGYIIPEYNVFYPLQVILFLYIRHIRTNSLSIKMGIL